MAERIVVALGGNALGKTPEQQLELVRNTARPIVDLVEKGYEVIIGHAEVRQTYKVSAIGTIAGCYVKDGKITRDASVRVLRDNIVIHEGKLGSLQRFKDSVKEVAAGYECGMSIEKYNDIKEGDIFECFVMEQIKE